ncbi:MAG: aminotransferase class V-fold PLP-dependent enzyme [Tissierellia bacterium]|nr:aminotransferase class V-fold PLP-dependent enzyme [Tissierellia bacterium]
MKTPIFHRLETLSENESIDFLMPGHKKKRAALEWNKLLPEFDTTETYDTDNLHDPTDVIGQSMDEVARVYGARRSLFVVNGSSGALHIAMAALTSPGDRVLIQRNSHISVYNAAILNRLKLSYLHPIYDEENHIIGGITPQHFQQQLDQNPDVVAVVLLHPSFYGVCSDLEQLIEMAHERGIFVIVDEAHGPHMHFSDELPKSAIAYGADLIIHSTHKTLPALTQTAMLHVGSDRVDMQRLQTMSRMFQTTSPSYIFMVSIEAAVAYIDHPEGRERLHDLIESIKWLERELADLPYIQVFPRMGGGSYQDRDFTKLMLGIEGMRGTQLRELLHRRYHIEMEYGDYHWAIGVCSLMNDREDFEELARALKELAAEFGKSEELFVTVPHIEPIAIKDITDAFYSGHERINLMDSIGRISASYLTPYPPGIPQLVPGELITLSHLELVRMLQAKGIPIIGLFGEEHDEIHVIK